MVPRNHRDNLSGTLGEALQDSLRGVYRTGSAAVGAYRPGSSDIDVLVAVGGADRAALEQVVAACSHDVYEKDALAAPAARPRWNLNFDTGHDTMHRAFDAMVEWCETHEPAHADVARARADHWRRMGTFMPKPGLPST